MTKIIIYTNFLVASFFAGCKKNNQDNILPPLTFEGRNTIGCKINGVAWVPKGIIDPGGITYPTGGGYYAVFNTPLIHIWIKTYNPGDYIDLFVRNYSNYNYLPPGKYLCEKNTSSLPFGYGEQHTYGTYKINGKEYITDSLHKGYIEILKSDSISKIISGRFEFEAYNSVDGKIYTITEGRFDYTNH